MRTEIEQKSIRFVEQMEELYFVHRDVNGLLEQMYQETSLLGTGEQEVSNNLFDARQALEKQYDEYGGAFKLSDQEFYTTRLSDTACVVYGHLRAVPACDLIEEQNLHFTVVCIETQDGMKLAHCNISRPDCLQEEDRYYVQSKARANNQVLRGTLEERDRKLQNLTRNIPGGVHQCLNDPNISLISVSDSFVEMFGYTREEIKERFDNKFINMIYPDDRGSLLRTMYEQISKGPTVELEYRVMCKDREPMWILDNGRLLEENGEECFYCVLIEITKRKQDQEELRLSLERHRIIMDQAADIIFEWNIAEDTLDFSQNWRKQFGFDPIRNHISREIPLSENIHPDDMQEFMQIMREIASGVPYSEVEFRIRNLAGEYTWNRIRATAQFDENGRVIKAVGVISDISAEKKERLELIDLAQRDSLTGLYNKTAIKAQIEQRISCSTAEEQQALFIIDIDEFKQVNDTYGHFCGDTLLSHIAETLKQHFRSSDLIGRIGGDEFLVYMPAVIHETAVVHKSKTVLEALREVCPGPGLPPITCSVGVAVFPCKDTNYLNLYQSADRALYRQKKNGKNGVCFFGETTFDDQQDYGAAYSAVGANIDSEEVGAVEEKLAKYAFHMLYQSIDVETAVNKLLEIVGRAYGVSRVYIFESTDDGLRCNNTFEWCAPGIMAERDNLQDIRYKEDLDDYTNNFDEEGVFYCHDIRSLKPTLRNILEPQGIRSLLQCAVLDKGQFKGYVGFDECKENCIWNKEQIRSLTLIANMLSVFLVKLRLEERWEDK